MKIEHLALWVKDLEASKAFYMKYFAMNCSNKYHNPKKQFQSYFLSFEGSETRIELMHNPLIIEAEKDTSLSFGLTHFSISVGNRETVDKLTEQIRRDGYKIYGEARTTGDGYYESVILDPDGNQVEITE